MKRIFWLFLLAPVLSMAQNFEFGLNGGVVNYTIHDVWVSNATIEDDYNNFQSSLVVPTVSLEALYIFHKFQFGFESDYRMLQYKSLNYPEMSRTPIVPQEEHYTVMELPERIFFNRTFPLGDFVPYIGLFGEYVFVSSQSKIVNAGNSASESKSNGRVGAGLHVGATYYVSNSVGINLEVVEEYDNFPTGPLDRNLISFPVTLGVRYHFRDKNKLSAKDFSAF